MEAQEIVEVLRSSLINAKEVLEIINEIEKNIESISLNDQTSKTEILAKTKNLVDGLFEKSNKTKNTFYKRYEKIKNKSKAKETVEQSSSSEYEDASCHINDNRSKEINGEGTGNLINDEINLDSDPKDLENVNGKSSANNKHLNSNDCNEDHSGVTQSIEETDNLKVVYSNNTEKRVDSEKHNENEEESSKSNSSLEDDCILKSNGKTNNQNDECQTVVKETAKDKNIDNDELEQNAEEPIEQGKDDAKELVEESGTTESATRDSIEEGCDSLTLEITEDEHNQEEIVINGDGDEEMSLVENESNNAEKDSSDDVETANESGSQHDNGNENSKEASKKEHAKASKTSEILSNKENSEEVNNKENCDEVNGKETSEGVNNKENPDHSKDSVDFIVDTIKSENKENIEILPKIRLVSLDKLMEKPKRNVTFDSSIIVLSSDEESTPEKQPNINEENLSVKTCPTKEVPENTSSSKDQLNSKQNLPDEDSTSLSRKSSRIVSKIEEKQKERVKLKSIFTRTKANEWKGKSTSESNSDKEKSKKKDISIVDISDSSDDDCNKNKIKRSSTANVRKSNKKEKDLFIPLPKVDCEKLEDICSRDVNIFSTQSILSRVSKRSSKRHRKELSDNSSDSDKGKTKRKKENSSKQIDGNDEKPKSDAVVDSDETDIEDKENSKSSRKNKKEDCSESEDESKVTKEEELQKNDDSDSSDNEVKSKKVSKSVEIISSDSEDITVKKKIKNEKHKKKKKKVISDSEGEDQKDENTSCDDSSKSSDEKSGSESESEKKKSSRRRVKRTKDSSESEEDISTRKQIRKLIGKDSLSETTKKAEAEEKERKARIAEKQKKYNAILGEAKEATVEKVVLEIDEKTEKELLCVHPKLVEKLKPHQASGIRFMWDACFESLERAKKTAGSGCILAHCMGLGKTLQVIALTHTLLENSELTGVEKVLVVCPVSTVLNWKSEFKKWLPKKTHFEIFELVSCKQMRERKYRIGEWHEEGGVLIIGYTMFRNISNPDNKKIQKAIRETFVKGLVDPGPDLVVCDEGHLLKNEKTNLSIAMNRIKTARRIVLTGTPLQNNLKEYWCMVQFIKPNLLGTYKEYLNRFVNPITNGQYTDSTEHDIVLMRKRAHVLHKLLDGVVQRRDYSVLEPYLPPKHEYVLFVRLSDVQVKLCQHYMDNFAQKRNGNRNVSFIFTDFQQFQRICTHPRVLLDKSSERREKLLDDEDSEGSLKDFIVNENVSSSRSSSSSSSSSGSDSDSDTSNKKKNKKQQKTRMTRALAAKKRDNSDESDPEIIEIEQKEWWQDFCDGDELDNIQNSGKLSLLFHLLKECEEIGDKILIFSQSLYTLNCIEYFLEKIDEATNNGETEKFGGYSGTWHIGLDYFRLDGSSSCDNRALWCDMFNNTDNPRARLFLISTKAGGLGINLVAANRVVIFDVSWNPSHDIQSIYRVFRFGQTKPCYIYRFVTYGAMEMKIYERQVTKQAISKRVIDEQQIDRHYNQNDLQELYKSEYVPIEERPIPLVPKDILLGEMLQKYDKIIYKYHEHQSLLENKEEECLNEEERKAAWDEFENEKVMRKNTSTGYGGMGLGMMGVNAPLIAIALANIVKRDNPTWSEIQVNGIIPALVQQLKVQLSENDTSMYIRVQQEIQRMQKEAREAEFQRQMRQMYAQTQYMQMAPQYLSTVRQMYDNMYNRPAFNPMASGSSIRHSAPTNDVIDLND